MSPLPINNEFLREWVSREMPFASIDIEELTVRVGGEWLPRIGVYGHGPISLADFSMFMASLDFYVEDLQGGSYNGLVLVIGENGWEPAALNSYLERAYEFTGNSGFRIRIYSQEMFLFRVMSSIDPFDAPTDVLQEFGRGHPALDYLAELGFDWPECKPFPSTSGEGELVTDKWRGNSPLTVPPINYHAGKSGIQDAAIRQGKLERAFRGELPIVGPPEYMEEWGDPSTSKRLHAIACHIANEIDKARRRSDREVAIAHWTEDLEWLKRKFYKRHFQFKWPNY